MFVLVGEVSNPGMAMNVQRNLKSLGVSCLIYTNDNWEKVTKTRYARDTNQMFLRVDNNDDKISNCKTENKFTAV